MNGSAGRFAQVVPTAQVVGIKETASPPPQPPPPGVVALREMYARVAVVGADIAGLSTELRAMPEPMAAAVADILLPMVAAVRAAGAGLAVQIRMEETARALGMEIVRSFPADDEKPFTPAGPFARSLRINPPRPIDAPRCWQCERRQPEGARVCGNCRAAEPCEHNPLHRKGNK